MCIKNGMAHSVVAPFVYRTKLVIYRLQFYKVVQGSTLSQSVGLVNSVCGATLKHIFRNRASVKITALHCTVACAVKFTFTA